MLITVISMFREPLTEPKFKDIMLRAVRCVFRGIAQSPTRNGQMKSGQLYRINNSPPVVLRRNDAAAELGLGKSE